MPIFGEKPFTSITVKINQLCKPNRNPDLEDQSLEPYVEDLLSLIKLQSSGAVEAARAIRKKIKYGNTPSESVLALNLLELLVLNGGKKIGQTIASDEKLSQLLRSVASGSAVSGLGGPYDGSVVRRLRELANGWKYELRGLDGYGNMATLYKSLPSSKASGHSRSAGRTSPSSDVFDDGSGSGSGASRRPPKSRDAPHNDDGDAEATAPRNSKSVPPPRPAAASPFAMKSYLNKDDKQTKKKGKSKKKGVVYADEQYKIPQINYKLESPKIRTTIADCHTHTTALDNALLTLPKGTSPMDDSRASAEFEKCRKIRRKVLRYLQFVGAGDSSQKSPEVLALDDEFLGSLIVANDQLVTSFKKFDELSGFTPENPASYHQDDREDEESASSAESYYSSESEDEEDSLAGRLDDLEVREGSSRQQPAPSSSPSAKLEQKRTPSRPPQVTRQVSTVSAESGDPFGDRNEVSGGHSVYY
ncbi:hypothetical protein JCM33374_g5053 [Metschnikowia sp. JCM 33374]|nr:hypothetical protein JCM33374_g5053 [Metschnikowia sp. JCM 33374]